MVLQILETEYTSNLGKIYPQELFVFMDECAKKEAKRKKGTSKTLPIFSFHV